MTPSSLRKGSSTFHRLRSLPARSARASHWPALPARFGARPVHRSCRTAAVQPAVCGCTPALSHPGLRGSERVQPRSETSDRDWRPAARGWLLALRAMVLRHQWWAQLRPTRPAVGPQALRATGGLVELLASAGLSGAGLEAALTLMTDFAVGATATSVQFRRWLDAPAADIEAVRSYVIDAARPWPAWSTHIDNHLVGSDPDLIREETFDAAIDALLTGVASLAHTSRKSKRNARSSKESDAKPGKAPET
jgi:Tetracyclin repressor-like, C-terminal domain